MSWLRLIIQTSAEQVAPLADLLERFDACAVSYQPCSDENLFDDINCPDPLLWQQTSVAALLNHEIDMDILLACIRNRIGTENILGHRIEQLSDSEWTEAYKQGFHRMVFADRLVISPAWEAPVTSDMPALQLEPGLAFGTGRHATTAMCLEWLARHDLTGTTVIDYGCGSGVLALAAARLGAAEIYALDIDPLALAATKQNAERNGLQDRIRIIGKPDCDLPQADILIANILSSTLIELAPAFAGMVKTGGEIVLSGILAGQSGECLACYSQWFNMRPAVYRDEWSLLHGIR